MPKNKVKLKEDKKNYLSIAIGIVLSIVSILMIGRVGGFDKLYLLLSLLLGDFTIFILLFVIFYSVGKLLLNKKIELHHIFFLGCILIYIGLSIFAHLGLYDALAMDNKSILSKTWGLYSRYLKSYDHSFSCGGGIIIAVVLQGLMLISGKIGAILVAVGIIVIGISYLVDFKIFAFLKGGRFKNIPITIFNKIKYYFKEIKYPPKNKIPKIPISILMDNEEKVSFTLQQEINRETFDKLKSFINRNHIYCVCDSFETSYTSSRFIIKLPHKSEGVLFEISGFFNKCCFFIKNDLIINVEISNQFKKLLTLKSILLAHLNNKGIVIGIDVDNQGIELDISLGRTLLVIGDYTSGVKTFVRCLLSSILFKGYSQNSIYFYDMFNEYTKLSHTKMNYINNERGMLDSFDEAFDEYERRIEALKYLNVDTIFEANKKINEMGNEYETIKPIFHIIFLNVNYMTIELFQKLNYLIQFGVRVGMIIIIVLRDKQLLGKIDLGNADILSLYLNDMSTSVKLFGSDIACRLQKKGDILYQCKNKIYHGQSPYISLDDFEKVINHL